MFRRSAVLMTLFLAGCFSRPGIWEPYRQAALAVPDPRERAAALATAAQSAGAVGDLVTVKKALADLEGDPNYDQTVWLCALQLGNAGHCIAAHEVAGMMKDEHERAKALETWPGLTWPSLFW